MSRFLLKALTLFLAIVALGETVTQAALPQRRRPVVRKTPPPETSSDAHFNPTAVPKLAIVVEGQPTRSFGAGSGQSDQLRAVEDEFLQTLLGKGYSIASRSDVATLIKEQRFQRSGLTESDAARLGKMLNVPAVMVVRVTEASEQTRYVPANRSQVSDVRAAVGARLVHVESGAVWWIGKQSGQRTVGGRNQLSPLIADVAKSVANAFPDHSGSGTKKSNDSSR